MAVAAPKKRPAVKKSYKYRDGYRSKVPAPVAGARIDAIKAANRGRCPTRAVVEDARPEGSPLHPAFVWHDPTAAELYREHQAENLVHSLVTVVEVEGREPQEYIANVSVRFEDDESRVYVDSVVAMDDDALREQVIQEAEAMLRGVINRYRGIPGLYQHLRTALDRLGIN